MTKVAIRIKGSVIKARLAYVRQLDPGGAVDRVLARLPATDRSELASILDTQWYPFDLGRRLDEAIAAELGGGRHDFFERLGAASAERNLAGVHRGFLVPGDPHGFLERAPLIYSFYYDRGRREYQRIGATEAVLTTYDAETFSTADCATVVGWYRRALELVGVKNPRVVEEECRALGGAVCRYRLTWSG
jgi:uncharacterized protein (TIGR02265 family)